jgi:chemotaxis protein CheD
MLPRYPSKTPADTSLTNSRRYVDFAIREIARQFDALGVHRSEVRVKLFGGADVLLVANPVCARQTVGKMNSEVAIAVLREEGFEVVASNLGGTSGFNIQFHTGTGEVLLRRLG